MGNHWTVERTEHGILLNGTIPAGHFKMIVQLAAAEGFTLMDAGISQALNATFAIVSEESGAKWRAEIEAGVQKRWSDPLIQWITGTDTGASSQTIFAVLSGRYPTEEHRRILLRCGASTPRDPDDFGRCFRLLERFPEWRGRLDKVVAAYPDWAGLVACWSELEVLWREESPSGTAPKLYKRMRELLN